MYVHVCQPADALKVVLNEGMPQLKNPFEKGRLIIQFYVSRTF